MERLRARADARKKAEESKMGGEDILGTEPAKFVAVRVRGHDDYVHVGSGGVAVGGVGGVGVGVGVGVGPGAGG